MEAIITSLSTLGGMGLLSAVLFYLHVQTLRVFREEIALERKQRDEHHEKNQKEFQTQRHELRDLRQQVAVHHALVNQAMGLKPPPPPPTQPGAPLPAAG